LACGNGSVIREVRFEAIPVKIFPRFGPCSRVGILVFSAALSESFNGTISLLIWFLTAAAIHREERLSVVPLLNFFGCFVIMRC